MRRMIWSTVLATALVGCARANMQAAHGPHDMQPATHAMSDGAMSDGAMSTMMSSAVSIDRDTARLRAATSAFRSRDAALAAGYAVKNPACISHPSMGAMGYHLDNERLKDDRVEVEHPEVLVYRRTSSGEYELTGVEYMVPFSAHPPTAPPPTVMGQPLRAFPQGQFWYRHVWAWLDNPSGLFEDWNPKVAC